jgi:predicted TIM-barrel fold metal-dependent hydrolase
MPVHVHSGSADKESYGPHVGIYVTEVRWWSSRPLWFLIWSGAFDRHPGLRFVVTECGAFWAADLLWMMDTAFDREHGARKLGEQLTAHLARRPSEVFDAQCGIGASNTRRRELARRYEIGVGNIMWGNDFPHPEGTWPHTREWLRDAFRDMPVDETRAILGASAAEMYGFDTEALVPLAARIGPTPEDLGQTGQDLGRWSDLAAAGRPWLSGTEATPAVVME